MCLVFVWTFGGDSLVFFLKCLVLIAGVVFLFFMVLLEYCIVWIDYVFKTISYSYGNDAI